LINGNSKQKVKMLLAMIVLNTPVYNLTTSTTMVIVFFIQLAVSQTCTVAMTAQQRIVSETLLVILQTIIL